MGIGRRLGALAMAGALLAAGCSSDGDESASTDTSAPTEDAGPTGVSVPARGEAQDGGRLVYGIESDTSGLSPYLDRWTIAGRLMGWAVYDPLAAFDADGRPQPYLAESLEPNEDFTQWTITVRDGVAFSDGTPLDSAALATHFERLQASFITSSAIGPVESWEVVDDRSVRVTMSQPWVTFPVALTGQGGAVSSPSVPAEELGAKPVGTGPFVLGERTQDQRTLLRRNPSYWQAGLPHLDEVEFMVIPGQQDRVQGLLDGDLDAVHTSSGNQNRTLLAAASDGDVQALLDDSEQEEAMLLVNTTAPPVDDVRVRRAMAYALDPERYLAATGADPDQLATGPFVPGSPWAAEGIEFPRDNMEQAAALIAEVEAEGEPVAFTLSAPNAPEYQDLAQELDAMWTEAGMDVQVEAVDQNLLVNMGIAGRYQVNLWRQFGQPDPDGDAHFWLSPQEGDVSLNFSRFSNEEMDAALELGRTTDDPAERKQAYDTVQEIWAEEVPYIWLTHLRWVIGAGNDVRDLASGPLPDGSPSQPFFNGSHRLTHAWLER